MTTIRFRHDWQPVSHAMSAGVTCTDDPCAISEPFTSSYFRGLSARYLKDLVDDDGKAWPMMAEHLRGFVAGVRQSLGPEARPRCQITAAFEELQDLTAHSPVMQRHYMLTSIGGLNE